MAQALNNTIEFAPFSFLALLAGEGQVPGAVSGSTDKEIFTVAAEEAVREIASDLTAKGDFFSLMVENGLMANIKIVRPTNLGGGFGGFGGGSFGNGALAH